MSNALQHMTKEFRMHFANPDVTEVVVNEPGRYGVQAGGKWKWYDAPDLTFRRLEAIGKTAAFSMSKGVNSSSPLCRTVLPGKERLMVCFPPATRPEIIALTMRRPSERKMTIDDDDFLDMFLNTNTPLTKRVQSDTQLLAHYRDKNWREFFRLAIIARKTIGLCGSTGSGKTTFLKRLIRCIPDHLRMITIEDTPETLEAGPPNKVNLFFGDDTSGLEADACLRAALRMKPDWLVFQEVTGAEAYTFLRSQITGHAGITTWHAEYGEEWDALTAMLLMDPAGQAMNPKDLKRRAKALLDIVVWVDRDEDDCFRAPRVWFKGAETHA